jgi:hypothetical protein
MNRLKRLPAGKAGFFTDRISLCLSGCVVLFLFQFTNAQQVSFRNPLGIPIQLSANFGELRTDHYHTGYDIRTNAKSGYAVYASAGGHVSRIKVSPVGFGNVIYLSHPGGYMTVYGHLDRFNPAIATYVKQQQYARKSFEIELFPDASQFPVKEGDLIGYSGNSGSSEGPHLHFEIRDASGETYPLNPAGFLPVADREPPQVSALHLYELKEGRETVRMARYPVVPGDSAYRVVSRTESAGKNKLPDRFDTIVVSAAAVGLAVEARDLLNGNTNGINQLVCLIDGRVIFTQKLDRLDFANGRYVNAHLDYSAWRKSKTMIRKLFLMPGDRNSIYSGVVNRGVIELSDSLFHPVQIRAADDNGNTATLNFVIKKKPGSEGSTSAAGASHHFAFDRTNTFTGDSIRLSVPAGALYEDLDFEYSYDNTAVQKAYSRIHHIHTPYAPLHSYCDLYILPRRIPEVFYSKAVIAYRNEKGKIKSKTTRSEGGYLTTRIREFGDYFVMLDTVKPKISTAVKQDQLLSSGEVVFTVSDNLSGIVKYDAYVDGAWTLTEYDPKNDRMRCEIGEALQAGNHQLKLIVKDEVNNESVFLLSFKK